jgi:hypothetical protein
MACFACPVLAPRLCCPLVQVGVLLRQRQEHEVEFPFRCVGVEGPRVGVLALKGLIQGVLLICMLAPT